MTIKRYICFLCVFLLINLVSCAPDNTYVTSEGALSVCFFDVGQGDSAFVECNGKTMLIDAGEKKYADRIIEYIENRNYTRIDYLVITHPHSDHIGGMPEIIRNFEIGEIFLSCEHDTRAFEDMIDAIIEKGLGVLSPSPGERFELGGAEITVLGPVNSGGGNINNESIVLKVSFNGRGFLFTGDAEKEAERDILDSCADASADVMKVAHHGSKSSTAKNFLSAVSPEIAVISVGSDNKYGHPDKNTVSRLNGAGTKVYRTDLNGDILITTDGETLEVHTER